MDEFMSAVSEYHRMQSAQTESLLKGDGFAFEEEIAKATTRRENAKYAILAHQQGHGC
jgi:hypothetical protein